LAASRTLTGKARAACIIEETNRQRTDNQALAIIRGVNEMFGVGLMEMLILGAICFLPIVGIVAAVVVLSKKKSNDE
jgi:hypothetical protein